MVVADKYIMKNNMSDDEEKKRPNANYRLSKEHINAEEITYHYSRERRLEKAPQAVRDLYKEQPRRRFSLLGPLTGSKPQAMMFFSIVIASLMIAAISYLSLASDTYDFDGNRLSVEAIIFENTTIVALKKTVRKNTLARMSKPYNGAVNIAVAPAIKAGSGQVMQPEDVFYHRVFFSGESQEIYRFALPFDADELLIVFQSENKTLSVRVKPE